MILTWREWIHMTRWYSRKTCFLHPPWFRLSLIHSSHLKTKPAFQQFVFQMSVLKVRPR